MAAETALERFVPHCPQCGVTLQTVESYDVQGRPLVGALTVTCGNCPWQGPATFWRRQPAPLTGPQDEPRWSCRDSLAGLTPSPVTTT